MRWFTRRWRYTTLTLIPLLLALAHAGGWRELTALTSLDERIYDVRLRATMAQTFEPRIVIVDIDEPSLQQLGHWPWRRDLLAGLSEELLTRQQVAVLGFDMLFSEPDTSSGLPVLRQLAAGPLSEAPGFAGQVEQLAPVLDFDARFADALRGRPVVLGYYFSSDRDGHTRGVLPAPVMDGDAMQGRSVPMLTWNGYGANLATLVEAAPQAGYFNSITDPDGSVRSIPLVSRFQGQYYESLALAVLRRLRGLPQVQPGFSASGEGYQGLESIRLLQDGQQLARFAVDRRGAALVPFRGLGGPRGGSFEYISAVDLLRGQVPAGKLAGKIALVGTSAPGLLDARVTPVGEVFPGVEIHANLLAGLLDGQLKVRPDYAQGFEVLQLLLVGLLLILLLPLVSVGRAMVGSALLLLALVVLHRWLYSSAHLVLPLASAFMLVLVAFTINMAYGYLVESRAKRRLVSLFGTYVPPELVDEMVLNPERYTMQARSQEMTVLFCDMHGFTRLSEHLDPTQVQALLNQIFSRLTTVIRGHRGTIDKYMGDCVMAFWGAPLPTERHACLAVQAALDMVASIDAFNRERQAQGQEPLAIAIGLSTGPMCVGDMGSDMRRSYTVLGDAVNLGARLQGLCKSYDSTIVASAATRRASRKQFDWIELDQVRVQGRDSTERIFRPMALGLAPLERDTLRQHWPQFLAAYRQQQWGRAELLLEQARAGGVHEFLCNLYAQRLAWRRLAVPDPDWDGTTHYGTK